MKKKIVGIVIAIIGILLIIVGLLKSNIIDTYRHPLKSKEEVLAYLNDKYPSEIFEVIDMKKENRSAGISCNEENFSSYTWTVKTSDGTSFEVYEELILTLDKTITIKTSINKFGGATCKLSAVDNYK